VAITTERPDQAAVASPKGPARLYVVAQSLLILVGIGLRIRQYVFDRSLWTDEAMIALNVIHKSYAGLTGRLTMLQAAPIGWLCVEKTATVLFGTSEMSLRLPEIAAGCLAVAGFALLARRIMSPLAACVALGLFALSPALVFFASDTKPYGCDAAVVIGLLLLATRSWISPARGELALAGASLAAVLLSYPAAFVVAALGLVHLYGALHRRDRRSITIVGSGAVLSGLVFVLQYLSSVRPTSDAPAMRHFWATGYAPRPLAVGSTVRWLAHAADLVARYPLEATIPVLLLVLLGCGIATGFRRSVPAVWVAGGAGGLLLVAAVAGKYPLRDRMAAFAIPLVFVLVGLAVDLVAARPAKVATALLAGVAFVGILPKDFDLIGHPYQVQEFRQAIEFVQSHAQPGDEVLVNYQAGALDLYYGPRTGFTTGDTFQMSLAGCRSPAAALQPIAGARRIWLLFGNFLDIPPTPDAYRAAFRTAGHEDLWYPTSPGTGAALFTLNSTLPSTIRATQGCVTFAPPAQL
jgi:hypothetical protein